MVEKSRSKKDKVLDEIRSKIWFYWIAHRIGSDRPADVRRAVEPEKPMKNDNEESDKNNKFSQYKKGTRCPNATLIAKAEDLIPGSSVLINHPLWKVLSYRGSISDIAVQWTVGLEGKVQQLLLDQRRKNVILTPRVLLELEKIASVDSLAGQLILFRLSYDRNDRKSVWDFAESISRVLVVLGPMFRALKVDDLIYAPFRDRLFLQTLYNGYGRLWRQYNYVLTYRSVYVLAYLRKEDSKKRHSIKHYVFQLMREGEPEKEPGSDFLPIIYPCLGLGPPTERGCLLMENLRRIYEAGRNSRMTRDTAKAALDTDL